MWWKLLLYIQCSSFLFQLIIFRYFSFTGDVDICVFKTDLISVWLLLRKYKLLYAYYLCICVSALCPVFGHAMNMIPVNSSFSTYNDSHVCYKIYVLPLWCLDSAGRVGDKYPKKTQTIWGK